MMKTTSTPRKICLFGASPDTGNRGVTALCHSVIWHLYSHQVDRITVFDHGRGTRRDVVNFGDTQVPIRLCGAVNSRRYYRSENLWNIRMSAWLGSPLSPAAKAICEADAIYDVSAGDSFTDLYGRQRFRSVVLPKLIALDAGRPLILLPQTYGPFRTPESRATAANIVRQSHMAWARDADSFAVLCDLLGDAFDPAKHRVGVDMAFALPPVASMSLSPQLTSWLSPSELQCHEVIGLNISGLIYNDPLPAADQFGLKADYPQIVRRFLRWMLNETTARVVLVPHVTAPTGHVESDPEAVRRVYESLSDADRLRVTIANPESTPSELKWLISKTSWFCGTRMHSTIAGLGSGVPTTAVSYSLKTRGVFETCGQDHQVSELRHQDTETIVAALQQSYLRRKDDRRTLSLRIPEVTLRARQQLDEILESIPATAHFCRS